MATVNLTVTSATLVTNTDGTQKIYLVAEGAIGATVVATASGKAEDISNAVVLSPNRAGVTLAATIDDGTGALTALAYTAA